MKNEIEELMMLTPKRKSILWRYKSDEDESIFVYGISKGRAIALSGEFAVNKEEVLKNKEKVKQLKDDSDINDGGISVLLENVSARIWELCDGSNTLKDIVNYRAVFESGSLRGKMEKGFCKVTNMMVEEMNHNAFVHN